MADNGVDALILLMNDNVVYATGASWPVLDAGLSHVERPVAIVLANDEHPHLFLPSGKGPHLESQVPADHLHGPLYLELEEGVEHFARVIGDLVLPGATVAVDELTGAMRRAADRLFPGGPPSDAAVVVAEASLVKTLYLALLLPPENQLRSPSRPWPTCKSSWRPGCGKPICQPSWCAGHSNWARRPTCSKRSGR